MIDLTELMVKESERVMKEIAECINDGYEILSWWNEQPKGGDEVKRFGMMTLIKRKHD